MTTKLKKMRESRGLMQKDLADMTGIKLRTLQYYEQGVLKFDSCRIDKIFNMALALDCDVEDILEDPDVIATIREYQES
jgi:transcriptional regulator with XRE-family HTH domain